MAYSLVGDRCACGVTHYVISGDATRGELRSLRERLARENVILHYVDTPQADIKCICGAELRIGESDESDSAS